MTWPVVLKIRTRSRFGPAASNSGGSASRLSAPKTSAHPQIISPASRYGPLPQTLAQASADHKLDRPLRPHLRCGFRNHFSKLCSSQAAPPEIFFPARSQARRRMLIGPLATVPYARPRFHPGTHRPQSHSSPPTAPPPADTQSSRPARSAAPLVSNSQSELRLVDGGDFLIRQAPAEFLDYIHIRLTQTPQPRILFPRLSTELRLLSYGQRLTVEPVQEFPRRFRGRQAVSTGFLQRCVLLQSVTIVQTLATHGIENHETRDLAGFIP